MLSLNTAVDRVVVIPGFHTGAVFRAREAQAFAGGKGLNVARVLRELDQPVKIIGFLGGPSAGWIESCCAAMGIEQRWARIRGESRTCVIVIDPRGDRPTVINEPGPVVEIGDMDSLSALLDEHVQAGGLLSISGSTPPGAGDEFYATLVRRLRRRQVRVLVDASGPSLTAAWSEGPWTVTPTHDEYIENFGPASPVVAARHLAERAEHVLLTLGAEGALYARGTSVIRLTPPSITTVNPIGSGDAFVAGWLMAIAQGQPPRVAATLATACGAANAAQLPPGITSRHQVDALLAGVTLDDLSAATP